MIYASAILMYKPKKQMKFKIVLKFSRVVFSCIFITFCSRQAENERLLIAVSIPPQSWFVSQIAGEKCETIVLAGPGQNPHNYEPGPRQLQNLTSAGAWILSGTEFEISLKPKIIGLFPNLFVVDGTYGVQFRTLSDYEHDDNDTEYSLIEVDRHTWLGRDGAKILAMHIKDTLLFLDKENEGYYNERYEILVRLIDIEFNRLKDELAYLEGRKIFVYHPSFGYFLDEFGIIQEAVETGGKEPGPRILNELINNMKKEQPAAIFIQTQFPVYAAKTIAEAVGVRLIFLDPLAQDWLDNIRSMGQALKEAVP
jgi:zinc transport system substrate-binding protein